MMKLVFQLQPAVGDLITFETPEEESWWMNRFLRMFLIPSFLQLETRVMELDAVSQPFLSKHRNLRLIMASVKCVM